MADTNAIAYRDGSAAALHGGAAGDAKAITVADSGTDANGPFRALYIGAAGNVKITTLDGTAITFVGLTAGSILPVGCKLIWSTGTTVSTPNTNIVGLK